MKKLCVLFLIMMLPLQSLLAEGQFFHALDGEHELVSMAIDHDHSHSHEHHVSESGEADHHHHCPGHCAVVLPSLLSGAQPDLTYDESSPEPTLAISFFNSRIERPNWC